MVKKEKELTYPAAPVMMAFLPARRPLPFVLVIFLNREHESIWIVLGSKIAMSRAQ